MARFVEEVVPLRLTPCRSAVGPDEQVGDEGVDAPRAPWRWPASDLRPVAAGEMTTPGSRIDWATYSSARQPGDPRAGPRRRRRRGSARRRTRLAESGPSWHAAQPLAWNRSAPVDGGGRRLRRRRRRVGACRPQRPPPATRPPASEQRQRSADHAAARAAGDRATEVEEPERRAARRRRRRAARSAARSPSRRRLVAGRRAGRPRACRGPATPNQPCSTAQRYAAVGRAARSSPRVADGALPGPRRSGSSRRSASVTTMADVVDARPGSRRAGGS